MAGRITKGISGIIGLGQEAYQHNKEKKDAAAAQQSNQLGSVQTPQHDKDSSEDEDDEDLWLEDDAQNQIAPAKETPKEKTENVGDWVEAFVKRHLPPPIGSTRLPAPVVIPQRRPGMRTRGFVRAYAPALGESGIDQAAWLDFLDGFHDQTAKQGWFNATNAAIALSVLSYTVSVAPSAIVHFTALAVHISIEAGRRAYVSKKTNSYLDEINAHYFQPRGLYAMIMVYDPDSKEDTKVLDFDSLSANAVANNTSDSKTGKFRASKGKTMESQIPEVCPLVFTDLEAASPEQQAGAFKSALNFTRDYYDRRSQAEFAAHNPDSKLTVEQKAFAGRYGDPSNFEKSGLIGILTGGAVDPRRKRKERRNNLREQMGRTSLRQRRSGGLVGTARKGVKKVFRERVLYLMVVNMPSEEEMRAAAEMEAKMKAEQPNWFERFQASS